MNIRKNYFLLLTAICFHAFCFAQVDITGPKCVLSEMIYQYDIKGDWKENDKISICVEGGTLQENGSACIEKETVASIRLQWSAGKTTGKIKVTSLAGTANFNVTIAPHFDPGFIETTDKQTVGFDKVPSSLLCTQASGGNCSPNFFYQWQESVDKLKWTDIGGATGRNLSFTAPLKQATFFRRKVYESSSKTVGYSNEITVFVTHEIKKNN